MTDVAFFSKPAQHLIATFMIKKRGLFFYCSRGAGSNTGHTLPTGPLKGISRDEGHIGKDRIISRLATKDRVYEQVTASYPTYSGNEKRQMA
jgi:hypothetical protein